MPCPLPVSVSLLTAVFPSSQEGSVSSLPVMAISLGGSWPGLDCCASRTLCRASTLRQASALLLLAHRAGPDYKSLGASILLVAAPMGIFFGFVAPTVGPRISWALVAVAGFLFLVAICSLLITATLDPGFIPREAEDVSSV